MSWTEIALGFAGIFLSVLSFLIGKTFSQSEIVLEKKREIYREFLMVCPSPNEAHSIEIHPPLEFQRAIGVLSIYASGDVLTFASQYITEFGESIPVLSSVEEPEHPQFIKLMTSYNRMVWAMRSDVMSWSVFATSKSSLEFKSSASKL